MDKKEITQYVLEEVMRIPCVEGIVPHFIGGAKKFAFWHTEKEQWYIFDEPGQYAHPFAPLEILSDAWEAAECLNVDMSLVRHRKEQYSALVGTALEIGPTPWEALVRALCYYKGGSDAKKAFALHFTEEL